ncbi:Non-structural maintenance of chromosome element 4 [Cyathus striatus]|nr:Non-structural maintenance of chromosome element 4 [Cyathus striatus]
MNGINLFKLIINPKDFRHSVENLFTLSFLIHNGKVGFYVSEKGEPLICKLHDKQNSYDSYKQDKYSHQMVFEFDMAMWRKAIEVFEIMESLIQ